jgi:hypothetical protein
MMGIMQQKSAAACIILLLMILTLRNQQSSSFLNPSRQRIQPFGNRTSFGILLAKKFNQGRDKNDDLLPEAADDDTPTNIDINPIYKVKATIDTQLDNILTTKEDKKEQDIEFDALDTMLEKARRRRGNVWLLKGQAMLDSPVVRIPSPIDAYIKVSDILVIIFALSIDANSFALGILLGKLTAAPLRRLLKPSVPIQSILTPLWPIGLAILLDQWQ